MNRFLFKYFFKNVLHSYVFWVVIFIVGFFMVMPFVFSLSAMFAASESDKAPMLAFFVQHQVKQMFYGVAFLLSPALGIIAGRAMVAKESEMLLSEPISRREFYYNAYLFHALFILFMWAVFITLYLAVGKIFHLELTKEMFMALFLSLFGAVLPFLWVGLFAINARPAAVMLLYIIIFLILPSVLEQVPRWRGNSAIAGGPIIFAKLLSMLVPKTSPFDEVFDMVNKTKLSQATLVTYIKWLVYGLAWTIFLLWTGLLTFRRKDLTDPQA